MPAAFITYYEALAKLNQVANKQTMFLAHILYHMDFDKRTRQYLVDMSTSRKMTIMREISPAVKEESLLNLANQYLSKLQKAELIRNLGRGIWLVDPMCYGKFKMITPELRKENAKAYLTMVFDPNKLIETELKITEEGKS